MVKRNAPPRARIDGSWRSSWSVVVGGKVTGRVRWPVRDRFGRDGANPLTRLELVGRAAGGHSDVAAVRCAAAEENMEAPKHFEVMEGYCCYRLSGHGPLAEAAGKVIEAITFARQQRMHNLLIDTTNWTGHQSPDTLERYTWGQAFAQAAGSTMKLAMVVRPEMVDPENFEVTVARNRGLTGHVFDCEKDALAWLLDPAADEG